MGSGINGNIDISKASVREALKPLPLWEVELMETVVVFGNLAAGRRKETASLMGSGINGNIVIRQTSKINTSLTFDGTASLMGSGINGNSATPFSKQYLTIAHRFPYGKWN